MMTFRGISDSLRGLVVFGKFVKAPESFQNPLERSVSSLKAYRSEHATFQGYPSVDLSFYRLSSLLSTRLLQSGGMMMGCLGMSCLRIADQPTRPAPSYTDSPSSAADDSVDPNNPKSSSGGIGKIKLSDGRYLAYKERGVSKNLSNYKIIIVHGFASNKEMNFMASQIIMVSPSAVFSKITYGFSICCSCFVYVTK